MNTDTIIRNIDAILSIDALVVKLPNQMDTIAPANMAQTLLMVNATRQAASVKAMMASTLIHLIHAHVIRLETFKQLTSLEIQFALTPTFVIVTLVLQRQMGHANAIRVVDLEQLTTLMEIQFAIIPTFVIVMTVLHIQMGNAYAIRNLDSHQLLTHMEILFAPMIIVLAKMALHMMIKEIAAYAIAAQAMH